MPGRSLCIVRTNTFENNRKLFNIRLVPCALGRKFILNQIQSADEIDFDISITPANPMLPSHLISHTIDFAHEVYAYRYNAERNNVLRIHQEFIRHIALLKPELAQSMPYATDIFVCHVEINVDVFGETRITMKRNRVAADNHVIGLMLFE